MMEVVTGTEQLIERAKAAIRAGDATAARTAIEPLTGNDSRTGGVLEILAGRDTVDEAIRAALDQSMQPNGISRQTNAFRYVLATA